MILRYHLQTRTIYIAINHEVVGGGDYLLLGAVMFNGQTNSLIDEPNMKNITGYIYTTYSSLCFKWFVFRNLYYKPERIKKSNETNIRTKISMSDLKMDGVKTKYILVHKIMNVIMSSVPYNQLVCWLPIGFLSLIHI